MVKFKFTTFLGEEVFIYFKMPFKISNVIDKAKELNALSVHRIEETLIYGS